MAAQKEDLSKLKDILTRLCVVFFDAQDEQSVITISRECES